MPGSRPHAVRSTARAAVAVLVGTTLLAACGEAPPLPSPAGTTTTVPANRIPPPPDAPAGPRFQDNADGTALDRWTGLVWELKVPGEGCLHCVGDKYTWSAGTTEPDGTIFTQFLDRLNNSCDGGDTRRCRSDGDCAGVGRERCGHAGHHDWRLPTFPELKALRLERYPCSSDPCIDASFPGAITPSAYWSSTTHDDDPTTAMGVFYNNGFTGNGPKGGQAYARAVRGGTPG